MSTKEKNNEKPSRKTHCMFVENAPEPQYEKPLLYDSLKEASDEADIIIKKYPEATCGIYQLRADLKGEVKIIREDYTS